MRPQIQRFRRIWLKNKILEKDPIGATKKTNSGLTLLSLPARVPFPLRSDSKINQLYFLKFFEP